MSYVIEQAGDDVSVVGYADGPVSAVDAVGRLNANVVVLEIQLPVTQGLDTISALRDDFPALRIVVCSFHQDASHETVRHGAGRGRLPRQATRLAGPPPGPPVRLRPTSPSRTIPDGPLICPSPADDGEQP